MTAAEDLTRRGFLGATALAGLALVSSCRAPTAGAVPAYPVSPVPTGPDVFDIRHHGAVCDGVADDTAAINTLAAVVSRRGGGTVLFPPATIKIGRAFPENQKLGGIRVFPKVRYHFNSTRLLIAGNCDFISAKSVLGTTATITADTTADDVTVTVADSGGISRGDSVFLQLGQAAYDEGEPQAWLWATVVAVPDSTRITLDRAVGHAMSVADTPDTRHRSVAVITTACDDWAITGHVDLVNPMTDGANAETGVGVQIARNGRIEHISGVNPGSGLLNVQYGQDIEVGLVELRRSIAQNGQSSKGSGLAFAESRNVTVAVARLRGCSNRFVTVEAGSADIHIRDLTLYNTLSDRANGSTALFSSHGEGRLSVGKLVVQGSPTELVDEQGATSGPYVRIDDADFQTRGEPSIGRLQTISSTLKVRRKEYTSPRTWSHTYSLDRSTSSTRTRLVPGLIRAARVRIGDADAVSGIFLASDSANGSDFARKLRSGAWVELGADVIGFGPQGASTAANRDDGWKYVDIYLDRSWTGTTQLAVEIDYFPTPERCHRLARCGPAPAP